MADPREFVLIGRFDDGITPQLAKINNQLAQLKQTFSNIGGKGARGAARDLGKFNAAVEGLSNTLKIQNKVLKGTIEPMRQYRREVGKTIGALKKLDEVGGRTISIERTNKALKEQIRLMDQLRGRSALSQRGGGYTPPPRVSRGGRGGGGMPPVPSGGSGGGYAAAVGGGILGNQVANLMTNAIVRGFEIGTSIMVKPFQYFQGAFGERVRDELDDLKAAGGFFSIAKRQQDPFVKSIDEAIQFQQDNNRVFAKMAAALPGVTNDYVQVSKRVGDTIARVVNNDLPKAIEEANKIRATEEGRRFYGDRIQGTGPEAVQQTMTTLIGDLTKQTVLAGLGGRSGAGGMRGAYGLPGLAERMISQEEVSMGQFQRYAAVFGDPMIADALTRNIAKINATQKDSVERLNALREMFKEILTPEMIDKLRTSFDGVYQSLRSAIIDPDTGIIGLGRQLKGLGKRVNSFGQYVDKAGKVVEDINMAADIDLSLFEMLRDIFVQTGQVLSPIVEFLPEMWDPLKKIGEAMKEARHYTAEFARTFNEYREGLKAYAKTLGGAAEKDLMGTLDLRASLAAINNLFAEFGVYGKDTERMFSDIAKKLKDPKANLGEIASSFIETFFSSDIAKKIGETIGTLIGTVLRQVADATKYVANVVEGGGFGGGFASGFQKAGGFSAIQDIFMSITQLFIKALITAITKMPLLSLTVTGLLALPAIIGAGITQLVEMAFARCSGMMGSCPVPGAGGRRGRGGGTYQGRPQRYGRGGSIERLNRMRRARMARGVRGAGANMAYAAEPFVNYAKTSRAGSSTLKGIQSLTKGITGLTKMVSGGAMAGAGVGLALDLAGGEKAGRAMAGAFGSVVAGSIGSVFGPAGTLIGTTAGNMIGKAIYDSFQGPSDAQILAARAQEFAAKVMQGSRTGSGGQEVGLGGGFAEGPGSLVTMSKWKEVVRVAGLEADKSVGAYSLATNAMAKLRAEYKLLNDEAYKQKQATGGLVSSELQAKLDAKRKELASSETKAAEEWAKVSAAAKTRLNDAVVLFQTNVSLFNTKLSQSTTGMKDVLDKAQLSLDDTIRMNEILKNKIQTGGGKTGPDGKPIIPSIVPTAKPRWGGALGDAVASEMRMKPPGSDLVIANSSETVIPAAGGHGMMDFVETLRYGFATMVSTYKQTQQKQDETLNKINNTLVSNQKETSARLAKLETKFSSPTMPGGLGGGAAGGVDAFTGMAQRYGLTMTSAFRPGDPGYHGANRARDYSNGTGPTPQMMQFAQFLAQNYGKNLKELIYTPLGFSIKNGQVVAPYAQGGHYNHVHVAYGLGAGNPAFFDSQSAAERWERSMVSGSVRVGSVTGNSSEGFGATINGGINVTVNAGATNDPDQLAYMVAVKIQEAVGDAVNSNILV